MNPSTVFSPCCPLRVARIAGIARTLRCLLAVAATTLPAVHSSFAQNDAAGTLDKKFTPVSNIATTYAVLYQSDNAATNPSSSILVGGDNGLFAASLLYTGVPKAKPPTPPNFGSAARIVFTAVPEQFASGFKIPKVLLGGLFGQSVFQAATKTPAQNITRVYPDGTQDPFFNVGAGANNYVTSILPLEDAGGGKIVVGGLFTSFAGQPRLRIVRLLNNGRVDDTFNATSLIDDAVLALAEGISPTTGQPDGTTLVGGSFNHVGGLSVTKLARLDVNGNVDPTFRPVINTRVIAIAVQPSGKIVIGGEFTSVNGKPALRIARLNHDGSLDTTFGAAVTGLPNGESNPIAVYVLKQLSAATGGQLYVGGNFTHINGVIRNYLGMIYPNGAVGAFNPGTAIYDKVQGLFVQPDGKVLVGETLGPKIGKMFLPTFIRLNGATTTN